MWREGSDLRVWFFTVMHNVFVNQIRSAAVTRTVPVDDALLDSPAAASSDRLELRDLDRALQFAVVTRGAKKSGAVGGT